MPLRLQEAWEALSAASYVLGVDLAKWAFLAQASVGQQADSTLGGGRGGRFTGTGRLCRGRVGDGGAAPSLGWEGRVWRHTRGWAFPVFLTSSLTHVSMQHCSEGFHPVADPGCCR